jgi:FixJ family two-component response regulator
MPTLPIIYILHDDPLMAKELAALFTSVGYEVAVYHSSQEFLSAYLALDWTDRPQCLISRIRLPGLSGLALQAQLAASNDTIPIIFTTAHPDADTMMQAIKQGAIDVLRHPVSPNSLLDIVTHALERDAIDRKKAYRRQQLLTRVATLTRREYEVMGFILRGYLNKQITYELGISLSTVELYRSKAMQKMGAKNTIHLARLVLLNDLLPDTIIQPESL